MSGAGSRLQKRSASLNKLVIQLSRLLRAVEQGQRFTISVRGKPVADLIPHRGDATEAVAAAVAALQATPRIHGVSDAEVAGFVGEGRL